MPWERNALLGAAVVVGVAVIGGAYKLGYDGGAKDLEAVNDFKKADLPKMLENLRELAADLQSRESLKSEKDQLAKESLGKGKELDRLKAEAARYGQEKAGLQKQIDDLNVQISNLLPAEEINVQIKEGEAKRVIPNILTIGVQTLYSSRVYATVNGTGKDIVVGEKPLITVGGRQCGIELLQIDRPHATFVVSCQK